MRRAVRRLLWWLTTPRSGWATKHYRALERADAEVAQERRRDMAVARRYFERVSRRPSRRQPRIQVPTALDATDLTLAEGVRAEARRRYVEGLRRQPPPATPELRDLFREEPCGDD